MEMEIHEKQEDQLTENGTSNSSSSSSDDNDSDHAVEKIREKDVDCAEDMLVVGPPELVRRESRPGAFREGGSVELDLTNTPCTLFHPTNSADVVHMLHDLEQTSLVTATLVEEGETAQEFEQSTQRHEYVHAEPVFEKKENQQKTSYWKSFSCKAISLACILALILAVAMAITEARKARRIFNEKSASSNDSTDVGNGLSFSPSGDNNNTNATWNVAIWGYVTNCEKYQPQSLEIFCSNGGLLDIIDTSNSTSCVVLDSNAEALCTTSVAMGVAIFQCSGRSSIATAYYPHSAVLICRNHMNEEEIDAEHSLFTYGGNATVYLSVGRFCQTSYSKQLTVKTSAICELGDKEQSLCVDRHTCTETQACEWKNDQWDQCEGDDECHFQLNDLEVTNQVEQTCDLDEGAESIEIDELWRLVWSDLHLAKDNVERGST